MFTQFGLFKDIIINRNFHSTILFNRYCLYVKRRADLALRVIKRSTSRESCLKFDTMPDAILGVEIGDAPNSGTGNNHDNANVIIHNS